MTLKKLSAIHDPDEYISEIKNILKNQNSRCKGITSLISRSQVEDGILKACGRKLLYAINKLL